MRQTALGQAILGSKCLFLLVFTLTGCSSFQADKAKGLDAEIDFVCTGDKVTCTFKAGRRQKENESEKGQDVKAPAGVFQ